MNNFPSTPPPLFPNNTKKRKRGEENKKNQDSKKPRKLEPTFFNPHQDSVNLVFIQTLNNNPSEWSGEYFYQSNQSRISDNFSNRSNDESVFYFIDGVKYEKKSFNPSNFSILWEAKGLAHLALWNRSSRSFKWIQKDIIKVLSKQERSSSIAPYIFQEGTRCLDISSTYGPFTKLIEKLGFTFTKIEPNRLHQSSSDVQEHIINDLVVHNSLLDEQGENYNAVNIMPIFGCRESLRHYVCLDRTGSVAAAIFAEEYSIPNSKQIKVKILTLHFNKTILERRVEDFMLCMVINSLIKTNVPKSVIVQSSKLPEKWFTSFGFISTGEKTMELNLNHYESRKIFTDKVRRLPFDLFNYVISGEDVDAVRGVLDNLPKLDKEDRSHFEGHFRPNHRVINNLEISKQVDLLVKIGLPIQKELSNSIKKQLEYLQIWPEKEGAFPYLIIPKTLSELFNLIDLVGKKNLGNKFLQAVQRSMNESNRLAVGAALHMRGKRYRKALETSANALQVDSSNILALTIRAVSSYMLDFFDGAKSDALSVLEKFPKEPFCLAVKVGVLFIKNKRSRQAKKEINKILAHHINNPLVLNTLALEIRSEIHIKNEDYNLALNDLNKILLLDPNNFRALTTRSCIHQYLGNFDDAKKDFSKAYERLYY